MTHALRRAVVAMTDVLSAMFWLARRLLLSLGACADTDAHAVAANVVHDTMMAPLDLVLNATGARAHRLPASQHLVLMEQSRFTMARSCRAPRPASR